MASVLSTATALYGRLSVFRGVMAVPMHGIGLVRSVFVVLALVVFLSGAFGHLVFSFRGLSEAHASISQGVAQDCLRGGDALLPTLPRIMFINPQRI